MTNIDLRFSGSANFGSVRSEVTKLERDFDSLNEKIKKTAYTSSTAVNPQAFNQTSAAVRQLQADYSSALASSGQFTVQQRRMVSETDQLVNKIKNQKATWKELRGELALTSKAYQDQLKLQNATLTTFGTDMQGRTLSTMAIPTEVNKSWDTARARIGWVGAAMQSAAQQSINLGKNVQWAGRQLSVGFTVPAALTAAALGKFAYDLDAAMASIEKVYDVRVDETLNAQEQAASRSAQIDQLRADSLATATRAAGEYGSALEDTLEVQGSFAAMGYSGRELQESTNEVMRLATLGEMDYQTSLQATIAMKEIYGLTTDELSSKINYLNAVESGTILTMEDFATAIPIAGAAVNQLGGSIEDLGTMLTAMRARGIDANEGANAIKSAMTRIFRPSKQIQQEFQTLTGKSIVDLVESTNGELIPTFQKLGEAIDGLDTVERTKAVSGLFGTYQNTRLSGLLEGVFQDINKEGTQTYKALQIASMSSSEQQAMAANELAVRMESASGRMKATWESFKITLAETGEALLPIGNFLLDVANNAFGLFNNMPSWVKTMALFTAGAVAIAGPFIMLSGLFINLRGQITMFGGKLASLIGSLELLTAKEKAAQLQAQAQSSAIQQQTVATQAHTSAVQATANALDAAAAAQGRFNTAQRGGTVASVAGNYNRVAPLSERTASRLPRTATITEGGTIPLRAGMAAPQAKDTAEAMADVTEEQAKQAPLSKSVANSMNLMAVSSLAMVQPWSDSVSSAGQMLMVVSALLPLITAMGPGVLTVGKGLVASVKSANSVKGAMSGAAGVLRAGPALLNPWTIAIGAAGVGAFALYKHLRAAGDEVRQLNNSSETLADIFDFAITNSSGAVKADGTPIDPLADKVKQIKEDLPGVVNALRDLSSNESAMFNLAQSQAIQAFNRGATEQQARDIAKAALQAAGKTVDEAEALIIKFGLDVSSIDAQIENVKQIMRDGLEEGMGGKGWNPWGDYGQSAVENLVNQTDSQVSSLLNEGKIGEAVELFETSLREYNNTVATLLEKGQTNQAKKMQDRWAQMMADVYSVDPKDIKGGYMNPEKWTLESLAGMSNNPMIDSLNRQKKLAQDINFLEEIRTTQAGMYDKTQWAVIEKLQKGETISRSESGILTDLINQNQTVADVLYERQRLGYEVYGNEVATANATATTSQHQENVNDALREYLGLQADAEIGAEQLVAAQAKMGRDALNAGWDAVGETMLADMGDHFQSQIDAAQERGEGAVDAMGERQERAMKRLEKYWDRREKRLEKERDLRNDMWDRELEMLDKQREVANSQYEHDKAVFSGDLDEAANIAMNANADARKAEIEAAQEADANYYTKALDKIKNRADAEKNQLKESQDRAKKALQDRISNERKYSQQSIQMNKQRLEAQLRADLAYTPATKAEADKRIAMLSQKYSKYGLDLTNMSMRYGNSLNQAMTNSIVKSANELKSKVDWAGIADKAASDMVKKMWGTDLRTFLKWVDENKLGPKTAAPGKTKIGSKDADGNIQAKGGKQMKHGGGFIGSGKNSRRGYAMSAAPMPSEVELLAKRGEFVVNDKAASALGPDILHAMNNAHLYKERGGVGGPSLSQAMPASYAVTGMAAVIESLAAQNSRSANRGGNMGALPTANEKGLAQGDSKNFGPGWHRPWSAKNTNFGSTHDWLRLASLMHTPIYAPHDGTAWGKDYPGYEPRQAHGGNGYRSYGRQVFLNTGEGTISFAHLSQRAVGPRRQVKAGDLLGYTGVTGNTSGHHTHVEWDGQLKFGPEMARRGMPNLRKGGTIKYDDTVINAHKGETVLTESLTNRFKEGVKNLGNGGASNQFGDIYVNVSDSSDPDVGRKVALKIKKELDREMSRTKGVNKDR